MSRNKRPSKGHQTYSGGKKFTDGITDVYNSLANRRSPTQNNIVTSTRVGDSQLNAIYKTGLGSKIVRLKTGRALKNSLDFDSKQDSEFYELRLSDHVKLVSKWMLVFGRGILVIHEPGADLTKALGKITEADRVRVHVFSGDMVSPGPASTDLTNKDYMRPTYYTVRGVAIHPTRVIDFKYVEPREDDASYYNYGGISEFELIYAQMINDGIVERATPAILEKNSTLFYKVKGFKEAMMACREGPMVQYFAALENARSIYGAGLLDAEDEVEVLNQTLTNLAEADQITLRRLAMVTGIALTELVGESPKGMNSSGESEALVSQSMIEDLQSDFLLRPINLLMHRLGKGRVWFKENQGQTPTQRVAYEKTVLEVATLMNALGEDAHAYLDEKGLVPKDEFDLIFPAAEEEEELDMSLSMNEIEEKKIEEAV